MLRLGVLISGSGNDPGEPASTDPGTARLRGVENRPGDQLPECGPRGSENRPGGAGCRSKIIRKRDHGRRGIFVGRVHHSPSTVRVWGLVVLAGFLCFWRLPPHYEGRVLNIHPAPAAAVLAARGCTASGSTGRCWRRARARAAARCISRTTSTTTGRSWPRRGCRCWADDTPATLAERVGAGRAGVVPAGDPTGGGTTGSSGCGNTCSRGERVSGPPSAWGKPDPGVMRASRPPLGGQETLTSGRGHPTHPAPPFPRRPRGDRRYSCGPATPPRIPLRRLRGGAARQRWIRS